MSNLTKIVAVATISTLTGCVCVQTDAKPEVKPSYEKTIKNDAPEVAKKLQTWLQKPHTQPRTR